MRSALMLLSVCGVVACEPGTCDAEEGVLLQAKSLIRKHNQAYVNHDTGMDLVQLKYMNPTVGEDGLCVSMTGCSTLSCLNNGASDATLQVCDDSMDAGQMFSHDASTGLLHSAMTGNSNRCLTVGQSDTHGDCEPFTLANCDAGSDRQQFDMEAVAGSSDQKVWRNAATRLAIDSDSYRNTVDNWIWACSGTNNAKYFGAVAPPRPEIQNGDFELSTISGQFAPGYLYTTDVAGWTATGRTVACLSGNGPWGGVTSEGSYYLALQKSGASISQDVGGHVPGRTYTLRVSTAQRQSNVPGGSPGGSNAVLRITVNGAELVNEVIDSFTFVQREFTYTAASEVETIRLENNVAGGDQTIFVDSISAA